MKGDKEPDLKDLYEWIARDWEIPEEQARKWVDEHMKFLRNYKRMKVSSLEGNFPSNLWIRTFFYPGRSTIIVAPNGQGKTYFASWIIRKAMISNPEWTFATNIPFYFFDERFGSLRPENIVQVRSLSEVFSLVADNIMHSKQTALILDETESFSSSHSWRDSNWIAFLNISRHLLIRGPLLVYHATNLIPYELRTGQIGNQIMPIIVKDGERYIASSRTMPHYLHISSNTPILPYSHLGWGGFRPDVDVIKLERDLVSIDIRKAAQLIKKHLDKYILEADPMKESDEDKAILKKQGIQLTCDSCGFTWNYKGKYSSTTRCPNCNRRVKIKKQGLEEEELGARPSVKESV